jgi:hypothetical protein
MEALTARMEELGLGFMSAGVFCQAKFPEFAT